MSKFVLILILLSNGHSRTTETTIVYFDSEIACQSAAYLIDNGLKEAAKQRGEAPIMVGGCFAAGKDKS